MLQDHLDPIVERVVLVEGRSAVEETDAADAAPGHKIVLRLSHQGPDEREQRIAAVPSPDVNWLAAPAPRPGVVGGT
jgi:hypothetical protein